MVIDEIINLPDLAEIFLLNSLLTPPPAKQTIGPSFFFSGELQQESRALCYNRFAINLCCWYARVLLSRLEPHDDSIPNRVTFDVDMPCLPAPEPVLSYLDSTLAVLMVVCRVLQASICGGKRSSFTTSDKQHHVFVFRRSCRSHLLCPRQPGHHHFDELLNIPRG